MKNYRSGFTLVELLISIVVIAILAAVSIVAYNGIQERSRSSVMKQDIATYSKAIQMYYVDHGYYPHSSTTSSTVYNTNSNSQRILNIPGLSEYLPSAPSFPASGIGYYAYIGAANGTAYKVVRLVTTASELPAIERNSSDADPARSGRGWGIWSDGGSAI